MTAGRTPSRAKLMRDLIKRLRSWWQDRKRITR
jgi:hypothetical protein